MVRVHIAPELVDMYTPGQQPPVATASKMRPSNDDETDIHFVAVGAAVNVQVSPQLVETWIPWFKVAATRYFPSLEDAMEVEASSTSLLVQDAPEFVEVQMPVYATATSRVPSEEQDTPVNGALGTLALNHTRSWPIKEHGSTRRAPSALSQRKATPSV